MCPERGSGPGTWEGSSKNRFSRGGRRVPPHQLQSAPPGKTATRCCAALQEQPLFAGPAANPAPCAPSPRLNRVPAAGGGAKPAGPRRLRPAMEGELGTWSGNVLDYFLNANQIKTRDGAEIIWYHAANNKSQMKEAIQSAAHMVEADILLCGEEGNGEPIMAHPPETNSDNTLQAWLNEIVNTKKGIKLDFKSLAAVKPSMMLLEGIKLHLRRPVWINADILPGPNGSNTVVDAKRFLDTVTSFCPDVTLSLGWTTGWQPQQCNKAWRAQVTTQSSSAQVIVMKSQDRKRAPSWTKREVQDLLAIWGDESVLAELRSSKRNGKILEKVSKAMKDRGHNRDAQQCRVKIKELRQAYHKAREANGRSGAEPQTCRFYAELHAILGGAATTTPTVCYDSLTGETTAANVSPSQRLVKIRKRKRRTRDDMFTELQMSSHADRAQQNAWRQSMSDYRKAQYEREERWRAESRDEQSKWRAEDDRWRQLADRRQESMLRLLEHQTDMLQRMVELQERQQEQRPPLQPLCNQQPSSPSSIASSPRRPRTRCGGLRPPSHSTPDDCPSIRRLAFSKS
ncbi:protein FAM151B isoform X1 [Malaclemys terrapin pileata]|uniref:protein FAM151B isoform X1 n=1 Tax=Malaclemys terrapin pileata TaxID=2991368 RepID=UPI0023A87E24|nr:protein FAM151B isoform X1 [Malaclemys terrapin pileata]